MRARLRPAWNEAELAAIYAEPHRHDQWPDHIARVDATIALARELFTVTGIPRSIADLSCGDAAIAFALHPASCGKFGPDAVLHLGDLAPGWPYHGPIEKTLRDLDRADLLICTETIEHLNDPDAVLALARDRAAALLLSTPESEGNDANAEHYWRWDTAGVRDMLTAAGWDPVLSRVVTWRDENGYPWSYQIWGCT